MEIKNRLFPYPVLSVDSDDYSDSEFIVTAEVLEQNTNNIVLKFNIDLNNKGMKRLVDKGLAEYVIHIECSTTAFRTTIHTFSQEETYRISNGKVNGEVTLLGMVVSRDEIPHFNNVLLNPDYDEADITIPNAAIMAYCNMPKLRILKNYEELANDESLFSIVKRNSKDGASSKWLSIVDGEGLEEFFLSDDNYIEKKFKPGIGDDEAEEISNQEEEIRIDSFEGISLEGGYKKILARFEESTDDAKKLLMYMFIISLCSREETDKYIQLGKGKNVHDIELPDVRQFVEE